MKIFDFNNDGSGTLISSVDKSVGTLTMGDMIEIYPLDNYIKTSKLTILKKYISE
jgi:hypothetical protein